MQYSKPFISIFKAPVYTKAINNDAHGYTCCLDIHICKLSEFYLPSSLSFMVFSINR